MEQMIEIATSAALTLLMGLIAGVFLSFSDFVMKGLGAAQSAAGMEGMQYINRKVYGSLFLVLLMDAAIMSLVVASYAYFWMTGSGTTWLIAGCASYFMGVFMVTVLANVPMNKRLDLTAPETEEGQAYWHHYLSVWTGWNHIRTLFSALSSVCFLVGCIMRASGGL